MTHMTPSRHSLAASLALLLTTVLPGALLPATPAMAAAGWDDPQEPFKLFGDTYYVGTRGLSAVLVTSPAGHILIDGAGPKGAAQIARHVRRLGFRVEDIRYILNSHAHIDHAGGIAALQRRSGATVVAGAAALPVLQSGQPDRNDPQAANLTPMQAVGKARAIGDGETLALGPLRLTAHATPGHTRGGTSWTWQASEGGRTVDIVYADSLNAIGDAAFRYSGNTRYPAARADIERSSALVAALPCDILVSAHPEQSRLWERLARRARSGQAAFIDRDACRAYADAARARLRDTLAAEAAAAH